MARFCTNCGKEIPDGTAFCTSCGTKAPETQAPAQQVAQQPIQQPVQAPIQQPVQQQVQAPVQQPVQQQVQAPVQQPVQQPVQAPIQQPVQQPVQAPIQQPVQQPVQAPIQQPIQQPVQQPIPQPRPQAQPAPIMTMDNQRTVKTAYYFFMMLVYALPIIGLIVCIITLCAAKNRSKKNFAKAILIWQLIGLVFGAILFFIGCWIWDAIGTYFADAGLYGMSEMDSIFDLFSILGQ